MVVRILFIALGGAVGTLLRYMVVCLDYRSPNTIFPLSTLVVNVVGSLIIGFLWGISERFSFSPTLRLFLFIGVLGGFTTFSTFSLETFNLLRIGELKIAIMNVIASNLFGIVSVFIGFSLARLLLTSFKGGM